MDETAVAERPAVSAVWCALKCPKRTGRIWALLAGWAAVWFLGRIISGAYSWHFFWFGSGLLLHPGGQSGGLHLYAAHPELQIGPLALAAAIPLHVFGATGSGLVAAAMSMAAGMVGLYLLTRLAQRTRWIAPSVLLSVGLLFVPVWSEVAVRFTHLDDVLALGLTVTALWTLRKQLPVATGLLLAAAVDSKPWAASFAVLILALPARHRVRALIALSAGLALAWIPFLVADPGTMAVGHFRIDNVASSALNAIGIHTAVTPWWDRPAQILLGLCVGAVLVRRGRPVAAMFAGIACRLLLDPETYPYYTSGLALAAAGLDLASGRRVPWWTASVAGFWTIDELGIRFLPPHVRGVIRVAYCLAAVVVLLACSMRRSGRRPGVRTTPHELGGVGDLPAGNGAGARYGIAPLRGSHTPGTEDTVPLPSARVTVANPWSSWADRHDREQAGTVDTAGPPSAR